MNKAEIRKLYRAKRAGLSQTEIDDLSLEIANKSLVLPIWDKKNYHIFLSITKQKEIITEYLLHILSGKDKTIVVPRSDFKSKTMKAVLLSENTRLRNNAMNIPEPLDGIEIGPSHIDVIFLPLLAFDEKGYRVGYGQGFYDRFLTSCKPEICKVGLSFFEAEPAFDFMEAHDLAMDYCITPQKIYDFRS